MIKTRAEYEWTDKPKRYAFVIIVIDIVIV